jgi:hypothetical protein
LRKAEAIRASEMTALVHNCRSTTYSFHVGLCHNGGQSAPKRRHMWRISSKLILNCTRAMWKNERQASDTTAWQLKIGRRQLDL